MYYYFNDNFLLQIDRIFQPRFYLSILPGGKQKKSFYILVLAKSPYFSDTSTLATKNCRNGGALQVNHHKLPW